MIENHATGTSNAKLNADEQIEILTLVHEQMSWINSLFAAIQNDKQKVHTKNLSDIGYYLTETWVDSYAVMRENIAVKYTARDES